MSPDLKFAIQTPTFRSQTEAYNDSVKKALDMATELTAAGGFGGENEQILQDNLRKIEKDRSTLAIFGIKVPSPYPTGRGGVL